MLSEVERISLYVGLNDKDTKNQLIASEVAKQVINYVLVKNGLDFTLFECKGVYTHESGEIVIENSFKIEILCFNPDSQKPISKVIESLKVMLNQESIVVTSESIKSKLA